MAMNWQNTLNLKKNCAEYRVGLWQCPQFLFVVMGMMIISAIFSTYVVTNRYQEPEMAAIIVLALAAALFLIGYLVVGSFEKVALASKSKSEFISIMSHQLRSPLSAIKWQLNLILTGDANVPADTMRGYMETIETQNERMIRSVNDLLEVNRIEDNDLALRPAVWQLEALTEKIIGEYTKYASANNVKIVFEKKDMPLPGVYADEGRIRRAAEHLVDNAIRYSINGGRVLLTIKKKSDKILWSVADEGHGVSFEDQKRIFEKFFRSGDATRYQTEGAGVGLFVARYIIRKSGGEIGFSSHLNKGSTFWFTLPKAG